MQSRKATWCRRFVLALKLAAGPPNVPAKRFFSISDIAAEQGMAAQADGLFRASAAGRHASHPPRPRACFAGGCGPAPFQLGEIRKFSARGRGFSDPGVSQINNQLRSVPDARVNAGILICRAGPPS